MDSNSSSTRRFIAIATASVLVFGIAATACGKDVIDDHVEKKINEIDSTIKDFVDTLFTDNTATNSTGG